MRFCEICQKLPVFGTDKKTRIGYCKSHQYLRTDISKETIAQKALLRHKKNILNREKSAIRAMATIDENIELSDDYAKLDTWFRECRKEMKNVCCECGKTTNKNHKKYFRWSICHIVPKSLVPSVKTEKNNWIELCQLHHQEFDSTFDKAAAMMCFGEAKQRFQLFKHLIPPEELRKINPYLLT